MAKKRKPKTRTPKPVTGKALKGVPKKGADTPKKGMKEVARLSLYADKVRSKDEKPHGPRPVPPGKIPWAEQVETRLAEKEKLRQEMIARGEDTSALDDRTGKCHAWTNGNYGPKRPCDQMAMIGHKTCVTHTTKTAKEYIRLRLLEEVPDTIDDLVEIRQQRTHLPAAVAAAKEILNRVAGKPDSIDKDKGSSTPKISIGINIGAIPKKLKPMLSNEQSQLPAGIVEAEVVEDDDDDNDDIEVED